MVAAVEQLARLRPFHVERFEKRLIHVEVDERRSVKRRERKPSLRQRIQQVTKAGLTITAIQPDGTLIIGEPSEAKLTDASDLDLDDAALIDRSDWN